MKKAFIVFTIINLALVLSLAGWIYYLSQNTPISKSWIIEQNSQTSSYCVDYGNKLKEWAENDLKSELLESYYESGQNMQVWVEAENKKLYDFVVNKNN